MAWNWPTWVNNSEFLMLDPVKKAFSPSSFFSAFNLGMKALGRKLTIIISGVLFLVSFLCIGLSSLVQSHVMLLVFRVMSGCAVGISVPSVRWVMSVTS